MIVLIDFYDVDGTENEDGRGVPLF